MTETAKNWRHAMVNPSDRLHYLLTNQLHTDVTFSLPPIPGEEDRRVFHAHKLVLIAASPVFETMFTGPLKEDVVKVEDVGSEAWWILLEVGRLIMYLLNYIVRLLHNSSIIGLVRVHWRPSIGNDNYSHGSRIDVCGGKI